MNKLGEIIKEYRRATNITRVELAKRIGISVSSLEGYEAGRTSPSVYTVNDIANALGMKCWELVKEIFEEG